jgi:pyruvate dehydrogenase E1 component alpha subunit
VIENNRWGMGTAVHRAVAVDPIAPHFAQSYGISSYLLDGMDFVACYEGFQKALKEVLTTSRPVLMEFQTERFKGHSISDPGLYRNKESLQQCMQKDPILLLKQRLFDKGWLTDELFREIDSEQKQKVLKAMEFAEASPFPDPSTLEEGVLAPDER